MVVRVIRDGKLIDDTFYFVNYEIKKDSLFNLPKTKLSMKTLDGKVTVTNDGDLPAVAVNILRLGHLDTFTADDNYFWLESGESKSLTVNATEGLTLGAWNATT